jgi:hypothetical protein
MMVEPEKPKRTDPDRQSDGRFAKGNSGGPGRKHGQRNRRTRENQAAITQYGFDPPHIALMKHANHPDTPLNLKIQALTAAAPYLISRPIPRNMTPITVVPPETIEETKRLVGILLAKLLSGELDHDTVRMAAALLQLLSQTIVGFDLAQTQELIKKARTPNGADPVHSLPKPLP